MISTIKNLFTQPNYVNWDDYSSHIKEIDDLLWRQNVRRKSVKNLSS
jgi:hypothetical protein